MDQVLLLLSTIVGYYLVGIILHFFRLRIPAKTAWIPRAIHFTCLALLLLMLAGWFFDYRLRGYWTPKLISWAFLITGMLLAFNRNNTSNITEKRYYWVVFSLPLLAGISLFLPLAGWIVAIPFSEMAFGSGKDVLYSDKHCRIELTHGLMSPKYYPPHFFIKKGPVEKIYGKLPMAYYGNCDSIKTTRTGEEFVLTFYYNNNIDADIPSRIQQVTVNPE